MAVTYRTTRRVEFAHTDMAGIIHFTHFFHYMEEVEHEFLRSRGLSVVMTHEGRQIGWPRVSATCDFVQPVRFEDVVDVELTLARLGGKSVTYTFTFLHRGDVVARGELTACCCLVEAGGIRGIELPPAVRAQLAPGEGAQ
jgi:4-hydroxybenzoyl-CoA thioesterase/acyl-CoA thioester hydrolase